MVGQSLGMVVEAEVKRSRCSNVLCVVRARRAVDDDVYEKIRPFVAQTASQPDRSEDIAHLFFSEASYSLVRGSLTRRRMTGYDVAGLQPMRDCIIA